MRGGKSMGGDQDENHHVRVSRDCRARWLLHDNPNWRRGVCRVQGLVVQRGPNGRRARVRREAGIPVVKSAKIHCGSSSSSQATACIPTSRARRWARVEGPFGKQRAPAIVVPRFDGLVIEEHDCPPLLEDGVPTVNSMDAIGIMLAVLGARFETAM